MSSRSRASLRAVDDPRRRRRHHERAADVLVGGSIVVDDEVIVAVGSTAALARSFRCDGARRDGVRRHARHDRCPPAPDGRPARAQLHPRPAAARRLDLRVVGSAARRPRTARRRGRGVAVGGRGARERGHHGRRGLRSPTPIASPSALRTVGLRATLGVWGWDIEEARSPHRRPRCSSGDGKYRRLPERGAGQGVGDASWATTWLPTSCSPATAGRRCGS